MHSVINERTTVLLQSNAAKTAWHTEKDSSYVLEKDPWGIRNPSLFWDVTQRILVVTYRRFGTTYQTHLQGSSSPRRCLKMGLTCCPERSVNKYQCTLRNIQEERRLGITYIYKQASLSNIRRTEGYRLCAIRKCENVMFINQLKFVRILTCNCFKLRNNL
jgi:hypothetical protein